MVRRVSTGPDPDRSAEYTSPHYVFGESLPCCNEDVSEKYDPDGMKLVFQKYLDLYVDTMSYVVTASNRVNYRLTKNVYVREYKVLLRNGESYLVSADCVDECWCCYGTRCSEHGVYQDDKTFAKSCEGSECSCQIYRGGSKWHVYIGDFTPLVFKGASRLNDALLSLELPNINDKSPGEADGILAGLAPLECVAAVLLYQPSDTTANDK
jgi:hypothetical protein